MAAFAFELSPGAVLGQFGDGRGVLSAFRAVDAHGVIPLPFALHGVLGPEGIEDSEDLPPLPQRSQDMRGVIAPAVFFGLVAVIQLNAEFAYRRFEFVLKIFGVILIVRVKGIGHVHIGAADVFFHIAAHFGHIDRHLPHPVKLVP